MKAVRSVRVEISPGELIDRITILRLKAERMTEPRQVAGVRRALSAMERVRHRQLDPDPLLDALERELAAVNGRLWEAEDAVRDCEARARFGGEFVRRARSIYRLNDRRSFLKRQIDRRLGATWTEEKAHPATRRSYPNRRTALSNIL